MSAFSRGFASVLSVYVSQDKEDLSLEYNGRDLVSTTTEEALASDWHRVIGGDALDYEDLDDEE